MNIRKWLGLSTQLALAVALLGGVASAQDAETKTDEAAKPQAKTKEVVIKREKTAEKGLTLNVPESWKQTEPKSTLRLAQFEVPTVEGEKGPLELTIFSFGGGGGGVRANVERWIKQFEAEGRQEDVKAGEAKQGQYVFVDLKGTFNRTVGPPIAGKTEKLPNARMLGVIIGVPEVGVFYLKLAGPEKSVTAQYEALRNSFGANTEKESKIELKPESTEDSP